MNSPHGMNSGITVSAGNNGRIKVEMVSNGQIIGGFEGDGSSASLLAAQVLGAARVAQERANLPLVESTNGPALQPSKISLGPCDIPDHRALVVQFGNTALGIAIHKSALRPLGEALLALSSDGGAF